MSYPLEVAVDSGKSRDTWYKQLGGAISDLGSSFLGTSVASGMGYVDEKGQFHQRTCFVAGTKVKTQDGYKSIETIQSGDIVASANEHTGKIQKKYQYLRFPDITPQTVFPFSEVSHIHFFQKRQTNLYASTHS